MKTYWVFMTIEIVAENEEIVEKEIASIMRASGGLTWTIDDVREMEEAE